MGNCFNTANWKASLTSPSVMLASPNEHSTMGNSPPAPFFNLAKSFLSQYCTPCAIPVVGIACMPVALL